MTRLATLERRYQRALKQCHQLPARLPTHPDTLERPLRPCEKTATRTHTALSYLPGGSDAIARAQLAATR
jgi:hypothetical protein